MAQDKDYVSVIYDVNLRPLTTYPKELTRYLVNRFNMKQEAVLLDVGCGRGEFLQGFLEMGLCAHGLDQSSYARDISKIDNIKIINLELESFPYPDNTFDYVFSKSVIEHFYYPEKLMSEMYRVLKHDGVIITMCPSWEYNYKIYFEDYSHRTPFMKDSLRDLKIITGFRDVTSEYFKQLPVLWKYPIFRFFSELIRLLAPKSFSKYSKFIRFSKEIMILATGRK